MSERFSLHRFSFFCLCRLVAHPCSSGPPPPSRSDHAMYGAFREVFEYMNLFLEERWGMGPS